MAQQISTTAFSTLRISQISNKEEIGEALASMRYPDDNSIWSLLRRKIAPLLSSSTSPVIRTHAAMAILYNHASCPSESWVSSLEIVVAQLGSIPACSDAALHALLGNAMYHGVFLASSLMHKIIGDWLQDPISNHQAKALTAAVARCLAEWKAAGAPPEFCLSMHQYTDGLSPKIQHPVLQLARLLATRQRLLLYSFLCCCKVA